MATFHTGYRMNNHPIIIVYFILLSWPKCVLCICFFWVYRIYINSLQFSCSVMYISLWPHGLQQARLPCTSPTPGAYPNSCPLSQWCHPTIASSVIPFSSCLQSFPPSRSFQMSQFFVSGGQSIGVSASTSVLNEYSRLISLRFDWFDLPSVQGTLKSLLQNHSSKASILRCSAFFMVQHSHTYMTTGKAIALTIWTFVGKAVSLLSRFVIAFLPRRKWFLIHGCSHHLQWFWSPRK